MKKRMIVVFAVILILVSSIPTAGADFSRDFNCVPLEVSVLDNRAHVLCAEPSDHRGGYPVDNEYRITYFAVPLSQEDWSSRFVYVGNIAMAAGMPIRFSYISGDYSGEAFGCLRTDCRVPWAFALVKTAWSP